MTHSYAYQIKIKEQLDASWSEELESLTVTADPKDHSTILSGSVRDQAALQGLLNRLFNLGLTLVALNRAENLQA